MSSIRILLADDHAVVRAGFQHILESDDRIEIIAQANNGQEAFDLYREHNPDVVVMDLSMPTDSAAGEAASVNAGIEAIRRIVSFDERSKILVLSTWDTEPYPSHVVSSGAKGYLTKNCAPQELVTAVIKVFRGETHYSASIQAQLDGASEDTQVIGRLTKRELQIFSQLAEGNPVAQIAEAMFLSPKTVHAHRSNILRKLELNNNSEIVHMAIRHGIVEP